MSKILYIFLMLIGIPLILISQPVSIKFEHVSTEDGLSYVSVSCIIQDYLGYMWFGTVDGLCKYDGYKFTTYRNDPRDTTTLSNNEIWTLLEDRNNNLWIGTRGGGLNLFNREKEEFISYKHDENNIRSISHNIIRSMMEDKDGRLWIGTLEGLNWFDIENNRFVRYLQNEDNSSLGINIVRSIYEDSNNNFWLGTVGSGLQLFDRSTHKFVQFIHDPEDSNSLINNTVLWILEDSYGKLWLATGNGLDCIDLAKKNVEFKHYKYDESDPGSLSNGTIATLFEDAEKNLWIGTESGINLFDRVNDAFIHYKHDDFSEGSLSDNSVWSIYQDRAGLLWFGTHWGGLNIYNPARNTFTHYTYNSLNPEGLSGNSILAFHEDKNGDIWIGVDHGGLNLFNRENNTFTHYRYNPNDPNSIGSDAVLTIGEDSYGNLWVGTWGGGVNRFDKKSGNVVRYVPNEDDSGSLCNLYVFAIFEDSRKNLWIGTHDCGLHLYNRSTDNFTHFYPDMNDPTAISSGRVWVIFEDSKECLWIGTSDGLNQFDRDKKTFKVFKHDENNELSLISSIIRTIFEDTKGNLWFGTAGGLNLFDRENETFKSYNVRHGLPNDMVNNILEDNHGNLWLGTFNGLSRFDPETETFQNYQKNDGLLSNQFNHRSCLRINTGEMFFGSPEGFISFHPDSVKINEQIPLVVITDFNILNKPVDIGPDSPLKQHINLTKEITLTHRDYVFSFEFAALDYSIPGKNLYKYKLENFDEDWNYTTAKNRIATYTNLDHGKYIFQVQGSNNDGVWNSEGVSIEINILPPWWKTKLIYVLYVIAIIFIIYAYIKFKERKLQKDKKILEEKVKERTAEIVWQKNKIQEKNEELTQQKEEIETQRDKIESQKDIVTNQRDQLAEQKEAITKSIEFASQIQKALLPPDGFIKYIFPKYFILYKPRDVVSGDFYWISLKNNKIIFAVADCTGHGVPGALMSMLGGVMLNEVVNKIEVPHANEILNELKEKVIKSLRLSGKESETKVGIDIALCILDTKNKELQFSGANNPIYLIRGSEVKEIKADSMPVGIGFEAGKSFTNHIIKIQKRDTIYLFSDGYADQFGGPMGKKFKYNQFKQLLLDIQDKIMPDQKKILEQTIKDWMNNTDKYGNPYKQVDDILVMGLRF